MARRKKEMNEDLGQGALSFLFFFSSPFSVRHARDGLFFFPPLFFSRVVDDEVGWFAFPPFFFPPPPPFPKLMNGRASSSFPLSAAGEA